MSKISRFLVGPFSVTDVNLAPGDFVAGLPSPFAALGLVGAISRKLDLPGWDHAAIPIFHKVEMSAGRQRAAPGRKAGNKLDPLEIVETVQGAVVVSFLIEFPGLVSATNLARELQRARFSGGSLFVAGERRFIDVVFPIEVDDLPMLLRRVPRGYALTPPVPGREDIAHVTFGERESLEAVVARAYPGYRVPGSGLIVPSPVGYRLCEDPSSAVPRRGGRDPHTPHVFTDQALGLAELVSIRNRDRFGSATKAFSDLAWRWCRDATDRFVMFSKLHLEAGGLAAASVQ